MPDYGSAGASCNLQVELDGHLLQSDLDGFHTHVKNAFNACRQAVNDEFARLQAGSNSHSPSNGGSQKPNGSGNPRRDNTRRSTASQVRALHAIADRQRIDLAALLSDQFGITTADQLTITEASSLIDELKSGTG